MLQNVTLIFNVRARLFFLASKLTHLAGITLLAGAARTLTLVRAFMFSSNAHQSGRLLISLTIFSPIYSEANHLRLL